jgi:hypothetical protein
VQASNGHGAGGPASHSRTRSPLLSTVYCLGMDARRRRVRAHAGPPASAPPVSASSRWPAQLQRLLLNGTRAAKTSITAHPLHSLSPAPQSLSRRVPPCCRLLAHPPAAASHPVPCACPSPAFPSPGLHEHQLIPALRTTHAHWRAIPAAALRHERDHRRPRPAPDDARGPLGRLWQHLARLVDLPAGESQSQSQHPWGEEFSAKAPRMQFLTRRPLRILTE